MTMCRLINSILVSPPITLYLFMPTATRDASRALSRTQT